MTYGADHDRGPHRCCRSISDLFLGGSIDPATHERTSAPAHEDDATGNVTVPTDSLTTHRVNVGMTGSAKTGLGVALIEEALQAGTPVLAIDPKGDLTDFTTRWAMSYLRGPMTHDQIAQVMADTTPPANPVLPDPTPKDRVATGAPSSDDRDLRLEAPADATYRLTDAEIANETFFTRAEATFAITSPAASPWRYSRTPT